MCLCGATSFLSVGTTDIIINVVEDLEYIHCNYVAKMKLKDRFGMSPIECTVLCIQVV